MANPTTNYGFVLPTPTDLVTDLPADFDVALQGVDTQMLTNANAAIAKTIVDAKGDIIAASAADAVSRLAVGANDTVLTADSTTATGLKWAAAAAGGFTLLSTLTLSSASTVQFLDINQTHKHLKLIWRNLYVSTAGSGLTWGLRINNVSATDYNTSSVGFNSSEVTQDATSIGSTSAFGGFFSTMTSVSGGVEQQGFGSADIWNYTVATNHQVEWRSGATAPGFQNGYAVGLGVQVSSTAITRLDIVRLAGSSTINGTLELWGVS